MGETVHCQLYVEHVGIKGKKYPTSTTNKLASEFVIDNLLDLLG